MKTHLPLLKIIIISFLLFSVHSLWAQNVLYEEDFNSGEATGWTPILNSVDGNWSVAENTATGGGLQYNNSNGADMISSVYMDKDFENFSLTATMYSVWGNKVGIIFNYQDEDNFYVVEHWGNHQNLYLREKVNGIWETGEGNEADGGYFWNADSLFLNNDKYKNRVDTLVASDWYETGEFADKIRIDNADGKTSVWINDVLILDQVETPLFTSGKIGFYTHWCPAFFDDIKVVSAGPVGENNYTEDFNSGEAPGWTPILNSVDGNWSVAENTATGGGLQYNNSNGADMISSVYQDKDFENFSLTATMYSVWGNKVGIIFNYQDEDNFYVVEHWGNHQNLYLREKVDGIWETGEGNEADGGYFWNADSLFLNNDKYKNRVDTLVASDWYETGEFADKIRIDNADGKTSVWINDVLILDQVETPLFTSGKIGCYTHWCPAFFDDIKVVPFGTVTGIEELRNNMNSLVIYPNPVYGDNFTIDTKDFGHRINIRIYNSNGQLVSDDFVSNPMNYIVNVNERHLNKGLYIIRVSSENRISSAKLVIN
jgi:hypothetical protein